MKSGAPADLAVKYCACMINNINDKMNTAEYLELERKEIEQPGSMSINPVIIDAQVYCLDKNAKSEILQVSDVILDAQILKNKSVNVKGYYLSMGDMGFIYEEMGSMNFISVNSQDADRETRKYLLKSCSSFCKIILTGTISEDYGMITLDLESIKK